MPRYFFHVHDGVDMHDEDGTDLVDLRAAQIDAVRLAGSLLVDQPEEFWGGDDWSLDVADEKGLTLFTLHFAASLAPALEQRPDSKRLHS